MATEQKLDQLQQLVVRRNRLSASLEQTQFELERAEQKLRDDGVPEDAIQRALGEPPKRRPRLVKADLTPRQAPPPTMDGKGFWKDD